MLAVCKRALDNTASPTHSAQAVLMCTVGHMEHEAGCAYPGVLLADSLVLDADDGLFPEVEGPLELLW